MRTAPLFFVLFWMLALPVKAAGLNPASIEAYLATLPKVRALAEAMQAEGKGRFLQREIMPGEGVFDPHLRGVTLLRQRYPEAHQTLENIVRHSEFTSTESWALAGDRIVLTYGAVKAEAESPQMLALAASGGTLDPDLLQLLDPETRARMELAWKAARILAQVSAADKAVIRPYIARLDRALSQ